jgi:hypothetical protein
VRELTAGKMYPVGIAIATAEPTTMRERHAETRPVIDREAFLPEYRHLDESMLLWLATTHDRRGRATR